MENKFANTKDLLNYVFGSYIPIQDEHLNYPKQEYIIFYIIIVFLFVYFLPIQNSYKLLLYLIILIISILLYKELKKK